jgi:site-specific DNA-cytosine methylase
MGDVATQRGTIRPIDEPAPTLTGSLDNGNTRWIDADHPPENLANRELPWVDRDAVREQMETEEVDGLPRIRNMSGKPFDPAFPADRPATTISARGLVGAPGANTSAEKEARQSRRIDDDALREQMATEEVEGAPRVNNQSGTEFDLAWPAHRPAPVIAGRGLVTMPGANANRFNGSTKSRNDGIRVTVQEAAVLQSFPADWSFQGSKTSQYQQVGNAVPPLLQYVLTTQMIGGE